MRIIVLVIGLLIVNLLPGQIKRTYHWYFGYHCGLDFTSGQPVSDTTGALESIEGSAVYSDTSGQLLYYSNGEQVWDRNHQVLPNGNGLFGNQSAVQSSVFVPVQGTSIIYLFTNCYYSGVHQLYYSVIDGGLNNGNGDVIAGQKNILLMQDATEALAAVRHCNGTDYWLVTRRNVQGAMSFYSWCISSAGISLPVISSPSIVMPFDVVGEINFSPDGKRLAASNLDDDVLVYSFDDATGQTSPAFTIPFASAGETPYSSEFSPDNDKLYVSCWQTFGPYNYVAQFDLTAPQPWLTRFNIDSIDFSNGSPNGYGFSGRLQLGPDGRIYRSRWNQLYPYQVNPNTFYSLDSLDAILFPDSLGASCHFQRNFVYLQGMPTMIGLPNFIKSDFDLTPPPPNHCLSSTGNSSDDAGSDIGIAPNPASGNAPFTLSFSKPVSTIKIINGQGQTVFLCPGNGVTRFEVAPGLVPGVYLILAETESAELNTEILIVQ